MCCRGNCCKAVAGELLQDGRRGTVAEGLSQGGLSQGNCRRGTVARGIIRRYLVGFSLFVFSVIFHCYEKSCFSFFILCIIRFYFFFVSSYVSNPCVILSSSCIHQIDLLETLFVSWSLNQTTFLFIGIYVIIYLLFSSLSFSFLLFSKKQK